MKGSEFQLTSGTFFSSSFGLARVCVKVAGYFVYIYIYICACQNCGAFYAQFNTRGKLKDDRIAVALRKKVEKNLYTHGRYEERGEGGKFTGKSISI